MSACQSTKGSDQTFSNLPSQVMVSPDPEGKKPSSHLVIQCPLSSSKPERHFVHFMSDRFDAAEKPGTVPAVQPVGRAEA